MILYRLKIQLNETKNLRVEELYPILWIYQTTPRIPLGESPFNLAYGTEAVIPLEIGLLSMRVEQYVEPSNSDCRRADLDLLPKVRQQAQIRMATYRQRVARYYNIRVKPKVFHPGDLVLRKAEVLKSLD